MLPISLRLAYFLDCALYTRIGGVDDTFGLSTGIVENLSAGMPQSLGIIFIFLNELFEALLFLSHRSALIVPVAAVAGYVEQVTVHLDIFTSHNLLGFGYYRRIKAGFACDLKSKRTSGIAYRQFEERFHLLPVVEHGAVDESLGVFSKMLKVLKVGCDYAPHPCVGKAVEYGLGNGSAYLWFGARSKFVNQHE